YARAHEPCIHPLDVLVRTSAHIFDARLAYPLAGSPVERASARERGARAGAAVAAPALPFLTADGHPTQSMTPDPGWHVTERSCASSARTGAAGTAEAAGAAAAKAAETARSAAEAAARPADMRRAGRARTAEVRRGRPIRVAPAVQQRAEQEAVPEAASATAA